MSAGASSMPQAQERRAHGNAGERGARAGDRLERDHSSTSRPASGLRGHAQGELRGGEILDREPERHEHGQLVVARPALRAAGQHLAELGEIDVPGQRALAHREQHVARLVERRLARVDDDPRRRHRRAVELACRRDARADRVHVRPGREPGALDDRLARGRRRDHHVGVAQRVLDRGGRAHVPGVALGGGRRQLRPRARRVARRCARARAAARTPSPRCGPRPGRPRRGRPARRRPRARARASRRRSRRPCGSR